MGRRLYSVAVGGLAIGRYSLIGSDIMVSEVEKP